MQKMVKIRILWLKQRFGGTSREVQMSKGDTPLRRIGFVSPSSRQDGAPSNNLRGFCKSLNATTSLQMQHRVNPLKKKE